MLFPCFSSRRQTTPAASGGMPRAQRGRLAVIAALSALCLPGGMLPTSAWADSGTPLKLVVTFPPGGSTDIAARIVQPKLAEVLGRPVVVENRPGAASQVATQYVARSAPDGNTLLISFDTHAINPIAKSRLPYDTFKDFSGVTLALRFPLVIGANPSVPGKDLRGFLDAARRAPNQYSYASTGLGSMNHLVAEDLKRQAGVELLHVPYAGGGPAVQAVLGNVSSLTLLSYAALKGQIAAGRIKPLAVTGANRLPDLPDVPTVAESGFPGFEAYSWIGVFAPSGTPPAVARKLTSDFQAALNDPETHRKLTQAGFEVMATDGPALDRYAREQYERWKAFVAKTGLKLEE
ncbi:tripartite tricarboxylate transporter substrate binding protein [Helicobacter pylori]|mgnify:FL=1|jgi:tripartite-type tricarboxylate transporter receptor subunit TctC|uniref:Tripartite tricarboxylate transporter substrate binding protein n=1 Tax=Cupriavidus metallidurans TaxID=119219 RepID=A0A482IV51_9BURK|nr:MULTISPECIES: tripartite tricarboxylate transporter substrate binding protein [Cupriavidus]QBP12965.1 tripartite tricarboxylate transporter substrate binding protein [Cupriavidus metallidurans]